MSFIHTCDRCGRKSVPGETGWIFGPGATCPECKTGCSIKGCGKPGTVTIRLCAEHTEDVFDTAEYRKVMQTPGDPVPWKPDDDGGPPDAA